MLLEPTQEENFLAKKIIGCALHVHRELGPGLLESVYEVCFTHELRKRGLKVHRQKPQAITYDGIYFPEALRLDLVVEDTIIVEDKAVDAIHPIHLAQLRTYLKLSNKRLGILINFNSVMLKDGIRRVVNGT